MSDAETFLHELERLGDPVPKHRLIALVHSFAGQRIWFTRAMHRRRRIEMAREMLDSGMDRIEVVEAVMERFEVHRSTAYRIVQSAFQHRRRTHGAA